MSSNISGFQGVNTPLQSMTNGKYTLADYTKMNTLFGARITALEKAVAFNPNNVTISGYVNVQPNASNSGTLTTAGAAQIGGNLQVNKALTVTQNAFIGGSLQVSGALSFASLAVNTFTSNTITNSGLTISNTFSGNGALLTGVLDGTKLPLAGGTITGNLTVNGSVTTNGQFTSGSNVTASDRQISSSYFNFQGTNNAPSYIGRLYASTGGMVLDFSSNPNGNFTFYANNGVNITNPLTITPTSVDVTATLNMGSYNINSAGAITGLNFYGNGSGLTNLSVINTTAVASGPTYFPLFTLNGSTSTNAVPYSSLNLSYYATTNTLTVPNLSSYGVISGNGSGLTNIANAATATNVAYSGLTGTVPTWNQSTTGNAATATNVAYSGLTGVIPTWNQNTTGSAATATTATTATNSVNKTGGAAGQMLYQSGASTTSFTATGVAGQVLTSQGSSAPTWTTASSGTSYSFTYYNTNGIVAMNSLFLDNVIQMAPGNIITAYFISRVIGQRFTFIRTTINLANGNSFSWQSGGLPYRVFTLDGTQTNLNVPAVYAAMNYTYATLQKIRSVFLVVVSADINYSFDLIEIS